MKDGKAFADSEDQSLEGVPTELNFGTAEEPDMQPHILSRICLTTARLV